MKDNLTVSMYPFKLSDDSPMEYVARLLPSGHTMNNDDICRSALDHRPSSLSIETMIHAVSLYFNEMERLLCNGYVIANPCFTAKAAVKGTFPGPAEHVHPDEHPVAIEFRQGVKLRKRAANIQIASLGETPKHYIMQTFDAATGARSRTITPGRAFTVYGDKIKLAGDHPSVGLRFTNRQTGDTWRLEAPDLITNQPKTILLQAPDLPVGEYTLTIVTQYVGTGKPTTNPVATTFRLPLHVEPPNAPTPAPDVPDALAPDVPATTVDILPHLSTPSRTTQRPRVERLGDPESSDSATPSRTTRYATPSATVVHFPTGNAPGDNASPDSPTTPPVVHFPTGNAPDDAAPVAHFPTGNTPDDAATTT